MTLRMVSRDWPKPAGEPLTERGALGWLPHTCFVNGPPGRIGVELEYLLNLRGPAADHVTEGRRRALMADLGALALQSRLTVEPGGQVELSSPAADGPAGLVSVMDADLDLARRAAGRHGIRLSGIGLEPALPPTLILHEPRYAAMTGHFDRIGRTGRLMMSSTASVQVSVEAGADAEDRDRVLDRRWTLLHTIGPALVAGFANSPLLRGRPTGWASTRLGIWWALDGRRTRPPARRSGEPLAQTYGRWCLDAPLLLVRRPHGAWTAPAGVTFRDWIRLGDRAVPDHEPPTLDDLSYHLTTLFPPVRARGHLEVRYLDAQPGDWWRVPLAVLAALVDDHRAADLARNACAATDGRWLAAARHGVHDVPLRRAATSVLAVAAASLHADPDTRALGDRVEQYLERWTVRGRSPGDDLLDAALGSPR